ncbi:MAG: FeoA family protein [Deltaproteobacteria bacterium]|nr:FeoA family protein [Deltaproteobacteria bacterium]
MSLDELTLAVPMVIDSIATDASIEARLYALGVRVGESVEVLRRAPLGGAVHVRFASGLELAMDAAIAACVTVRPRVVPVYVGTE